jgi:hypothetical protein
MGSWEFPKPSRNKQRRCLHRSAGVLTQCPHNDIKIAIAVYIPGGSDAVAKPATFLICRVIEGDRWRRGNSRCRAVINKGVAFIRSAGVLIRCPHNDIGIAIAVYISGGSDAEAKLATSLICRVIQGDRWGRGNPRRRAVINKGVAFIA